MYFAFFILLSVFLHGKQTDGLYICLASYVISVRRTKSLLTASFRFYLTIDTLAVQLYTSLSPRRVRDFHPLERAHGAQTKISPAIAWLTIQKFIIFLFQCNKHVKCLMYASVACVGCIAGWALVELGAVAGAGLGTITTIYSGLDAILKLLERASIILRN